MSKIHVLETGPGHLMRCVAHFSVPGSSNAAGVSWAAIAASMAGEPQAGDEAEQAAIRAGTVAEVAFAEAIAPELPAATIRADLDRAADQAIAQAKRELAARYRYTGYAFGEVS